MPVCGSNEVSSRRVRLAQPAPGSPGERLFNSHAPPWTVSYLGAVAEWPERVLFGPFQKPFF